jgi:hypothetical protein
MSRKFLKDTHIELPEKLCSYGFVCVTGEKGQGCMSMINTNNLEDVLFMVSEMVVTGCGVAHKITGEDYLKASDAFMHTVLDQVANRLVEKEREMMEGNK